jgi:hypothetical protein
VPYRERSSTWQRALEEAEDLSAQPVEAFAGRIPIARRVADRLATALEEAVSAAPALELDELVVAMRVTLETLREKLADAERKPDIVVHVPGPLAARARGEWRDVMMFDPLHVPVAPSPPPPKDAAMKKALETDQGRLLGTIRGLVHERVRPICDLLRGARDVTDRTTVARALAAIEPTLGEGRRLLTTRATGLDPETDAALADAWWELFTEIERTEAEVELVKRWLDETALDT